MKETNEFNELQSFNVKIIQAALLPAKPISPNTKRITFMSYLISLLIIFSLLIYLGIQLKQKLKS